MKHHALQFALRETRATFCSKRTWIVLVVISLVLGISGPFGTFELFSFGPRLIYWALVSILTFAAGAFFGSWCSGALQAKKWPLTLRMIIIGISAGIPVALVVWLINFVVFGIDNMTMPAMLTLGFYSIVIAMGIAVLFILFESKNVDGAPPILLRIPTHLRGKLLSISVQDHYVEIVTSKGKHLVLMRLGDAIKETSGIEGMQIHRSHWVAISGVKSVKKANGKAIVLTLSGKELPVSRTYLPALVEAGLLV